MSHRWSGADSLLTVDLKPVFRADTDQAGEWYVWRRVSASAWATHHRCDSRQAAVTEAQTLNECWEQSRAAAPHAG